MKEESDHESSFTSLKEDFDSLWVSKTSYVKCLQKKLGYFACMNKRCIHKNPIICNDDLCQCKINHKKCLHVDINKMVSAIKQQAYPFSLIKQKINIIFENAIDKLSQMQEKILINYQKLFQFQAYSIDQRTFLQSLESESENLITSELMYEINAKMFDRQDPKSLITKIIQKIQKIENKIMTKIDNFSYQLEGKLLQLENHITNNGKQEIFGLFEDSKIISGRKDQQLLYSFFQQKILYAEPMYLASQQNFQKTRFQDTCVNIKSLLFVIRTQHGKVIGGYTPLAFSSQSRQIFQKDTSLKSFLFSITEKDKLPLTNQIQAAWNASLEGCYICGFGYDLVIGNKANESQVSYSQLSDSYAHKKYPDNRQGWKKFTGSDKKKFKINEWEVWRVVLDKVKK